MVAAENPPAWWQTRRLAWALIALSAVPLLWPDIPPLVDLPGHMGRYRVQLGLADSPALQRFFRFEWALIGNLGVDLLVVPLSKLFGLELAVKLIVLSIPPLTVAGFLLVAREVHGRVPPTALFAVPLAYSYPFHFGFANFALSMALAFLAFALWLRLARLERLRLRAAIFVPLSLGLWVTHAFGWGTLGLMAFCAETVRQHDRGRGFVAAGFASASHCLALAPPLLLMLAWRSGQVGGGTGDWFNWGNKFQSFVMILRDRWMPFDVAALGVLLFVLVIAVRGRVGFSRNLGASAIVLLLVFLALPRIVFGSAYADMRLIPYALAVAILGVRAGAALQHRVAWLALGFVLLRMAGTTVSFWHQDRIFDRRLAALDHVPRGGRIVSFVGTACRDDWRMTRTYHLPALGLVRRDAFSNDQWALAGAQLLGVDYPAGGRFVTDPSQFVTPNDCRTPVWLTIDDALRTFPRAAFDQVWLIDPPTYDPRLTRGLRPVWRDGRSVLYRVER